MIYARQSTAIIVTVGPTLDADGVAVTGGVVADYKVSKNGGAPAALNASATYTHRHTGYGSLSLTASDVDTVGTVEITMDDTVNACPMKEIQVLEPVVYDALFADAATGMLPANVIQWLGVAPLALSSQQVQAVVPNTQKVDVETIKTNPVVNGGTITFPTNATVASTTNITAGTITTVTNLTNLPAAAQASIDAIEADTNELQTDWVNGGRLDLILDAALADTNELQTDWVNGGRLDLLLDAALADTNELQTDWVNGGRLDLILDARASQTSVDDLPTNAELATALGTADDATLAAIAALSIPTTAQIATAVLTTQMTEAYAANGVAPTLAQAIFALHGYLMTFTITSTSYTVKKLDGTTTAFIVTLNDATSPTGATRS